MHVTHAVMPHGASRPQESAMGKAETHVGKLSSWGTAVPAYKVSKVRGAQE